MAAFNLTSLLESLPNSTDWEKSLLDLKTIFTSLSPSELRNVAQELSFHVIFDILNTDNKEVLELCCNVLEKLLDASGPVTVFQRYREEILKGLSHPQITVKCLCLRQMVVASVEVIDELLPHREMLQKTATMLSDDIQVANLASKVLINLGRTQQGLAVLFSNQMTHCLEQVLNISDTVRFRVYEMLIQICKLSLAALENTHHSGLLQQLLNEVHKDDILVQLNAIEMLSDLTMVDHGLVYLDQQGIVGKLENMMGELDSHPLGNLLLPGLTKFFGGVARFHPKEVCGSNKTFVSSVFDGLSSSDQTQKSLSVQTVGFIGESVEGKMALDKLGNTMIHGVKLIGAMIRDAPSELRIKALDTVCSITKLQISEQTDELLKLTEKWFSLLSKNSFETLMSLVRQPFTDLRCSSHCVLQSLALQPWGQNLMNNYPGFNEFLLDRTTEKTKETKESKFAIIKTIAESPTAVDIFGQPYIVQVKALALQGPFFVQTQSEVAFEGE
ncbi:26S proteasome non-ATPase regulatory subunit 5-like [Crassostrea virginica]|uniref:26S proteasome non-ATPase regulatory subunit 5 n=1 Tax=Crassostrea virginica TaxID=6565 RepID=A0A8B8DNT5_CRAVI|nr:26S proteasome non-ATPase regulatory subunit 5-like [Crassostrea virginica]